MATAQLRITFATTGTMCMVFDTMTMRRKRLFRLSLSLLLCWWSAGGCTSLFAAATPSDDATRLTEARKDPKPGGFHYFVGIVGNPSVPDIRWSDEELEQIKALGVNMVQLSIAWGGKPANEVLNLEDLDHEQREKFAFRIKQAKKHGLKTIAQFGIPRVIKADPLQPACILDPTVRKKTVEQLTDFMTSFPDVDDVLVYTFDQQAWLCSEFGPCPRCSGVPLDERVPAFLNLLNETMQKCRPNTRLWWKPWELSKGQVVAILEKVRPDHFGLVLNPSTSNEVYPFNDRSFKSDLGVKRFVQLAKERNIPVLGEFDHTLYKPLYLMEDFFPQLIYEQMMSWQEMEGVVGVKEYYGFAPSTFSVNAAMLGAWMKAPQAPLDTLLREIAAPYGAKAAPLMIQAWEYVSQHVQAYPWDVTYLIGPLALDRHWDGAHDWEPVNIPNATWDTPIWKANRRANFMLTQDKTAHPWLFEDAGLRLEDSAALAFKAVGCFDQAIAAGSGKAGDIRTQREIVWKTARSLRAKALHFQLTLAAQDARMAQGYEPSFALATKRMEALLEKDLENQAGNAAVAQKLAEFRRDPKTWLDGNFNPLRSPAEFKNLPGHETRATVDWSKWLPGKELRIPRVTKPWKEALRLVGDGKPLYSDFALIKDQRDQWHCIGTFGESPDTLGSGYVLSDGYALFHAVGSSLNAPMTLLDKIPYQIASPQAYMWAPAAIWNRDRTTACLFYFHYLGSSECKENCVRLLTSNSPDLKAWHPYDGADLPERNMVFRERDDRDFCVFWDDRLGSYLMYYACAGTYAGLPGLNTIVRVRTSKDLLHWSEPVTVMGPPPGYQCAESPLVIYRAGYYYLWVSGIDYSRVSLYISEDPFNFGDPTANRIEEQPGHAPEVVSDQGQDYMACSMVSTGPSATPAAHDLEGILIQPLRWDEPAPDMPARVTRQK